VGGADPNFYLERQITYAALGLVLLVVAQHWDYRRLRALAPGLVVVSLFLLLAVLAVAPAVNGARRWIAIGPAVFQPSELAKLALAIWAASYLSRRSPPRTLGELAKPFGLLGCLFAGLIVLEPDLGTAIAIVLMLFAMLLVAGTRGSSAPRSRSRSRQGASRSTSSPTAARASSPSCTRGTTRRAAASRSSRP
jgi:cell division protein FtsW (lipid II flippase)